MNKSISKYIGLCLLFMISTISCNIKEDLSKCPGTILLDYTSYSKEILDEIAPDEQVRVYIFDRDGVCQEIYTHTYGELQAIDFEFKVPIRYNGLYAVVWHGNNSLDYDDETMVLGERIEDFYLRLNYNVSRNSFSKVPDPLWASPLEPIDYCASKSRHRIHMTRIHTRININLRQRQANGSIKELNMAEYKATILSQNDVYHTDYSISQQSDQLRFTNSDELAENTFLDWAHVGTLRITPQMYCVLTIAEKDYPDNPILLGGTTHFDLVKYMLASRDTKADVVGGEDEKISDQRFLDLNKIWNVEFLLDPGNIALALTINGWTVWFDDVDLDDERMF